MTKRQRSWEDVEVGEALGPVAFPLPLYRLVMAAGANRDFNSIHHNTELARVSGASDAYANYNFLLGMWERALREFAGASAKMRSIRGLRMRSFNVAGETPVVRGEVLRKWEEGGEWLVEIRLLTENAGRVTVGPGEAIVALPRNLV